LLEDVAGVLERQEELGVVHRDIKPSNLFLRPDGSTCLFDYGLVGFSAGDEHSDSSDGTATQAGKIIGTILYMAPEQLTGNGVGPWTDIFALGLTAWEALVGHRPPGRDAGGISAISQAIPTIRTYRNDVPAEVERMIAAMVSLNRGDRYASAADLRRDIGQYRYEGRRIHGPAKGRAFIAMPFHKRFDPVWQAIEGACIDARFRPTRVDRLVHVENIWAQIAAEIAGCAVLIADFSGGWLSTAPNPNVITEAAYAVAIKKPIIVLTQHSPESLPFDWRHVPVVRYSRNAAGLPRLAEAIQSRLRHLSSSDSA
jgi:serine/threonine protein kinase